MLRTHHRFFRLLFQLSDALVVGLCWLLAYYVRFYQPIDGIPQVEIAPFDSYLNATLLIMFVWYLGLQLSGAYKSWRMETFGAELFTLIKASAIGFLVFVTYSHFTAREELSRWVMFLFFVFAIFGLCASRSLLRGGLKFLRRRGLNQRYLLLVGDPQLALAMKKRMIENHELGIQVLGIVPVGSNSNLAGWQKNEVLGTTEELESIAQKLGANYVSICLRNEDASRMDSILNSLMNLNIDIKIVPDISQYSILGFEVEEFDGLPLLSLNQSPILGWNAVLKRISDIVFGSLALTLFSPVMLFITLAIKLSSRGPIFYYQERMGLDGQTFFMIKFRSMRIDAESKSGAVWAAQNDDRVTWIGKLTRKTSLDELPQLFNVLKGEMSCVGPRPERPVFVEKFKKEIPGYMLRHKVKAGMTGWAQINGLRGNTSLQARIEHDLYYITHWSLWLDIKILFLTIFKGFVSPHAY
ncbi:MAG: undecaprenyl-phosphate glucose phosphotransferase [Bdellovibrionales bacterium]